MNERHHPRNADFAHLWSAYGSVRDGIDRLAARNGLATAYYPLVIRIARRMSDSLPASTSVDDLVSLGTFGLLEAIDRYDPSRECTFKSYGTARIRGSILDGLRRMDWVPRLVRLRGMLVERTKRRLHGGLGREPTTSEMATVLGLSEPAYTRVSRDASPIHMCSMTHTGADGARGADEPGPISCVVDELSPNPATESAESENFEFMLSLLDARERTIASLYYVESRTMKQIGKVLDVSESLISLLHAGLLRKLKAFGSALR